MPQPQALVRGLNCSGWPRRFLAGGQGLRLSVEWPRTVGQALCY